VSLEISRWSEREREATEGERERRRQGFSGGERERRLREGGKE
jgi:hypothetical protein